jgi:NAD(P)-dependent dehydrogenase (short-subunit alcohol dehydrogenase family)
VAREIKGAGGAAEAITVDTRSPSSISQLFAQIRAKYGHLDVLVYNSGAIWWASVEDTPFKRFKLMQEVNAEGLYSTIQEALPLFAANDWKGRVIVVSPPIYSRFFRGKTAYSMSKVAMSVLTKGLAMDWVRQDRKNMAITSIWPAAAIQSAATGQSERDDPAVSGELRKPEIFSDAIIAMLQAPAEEVNGLLDTDEDFLRKRGVTDFSKYSLVPGAAPRRIMPASFPDLSVAEQDDEGRRVDSAAQRGKEPIRSSKI